MAKTAMNCGQESVPINELVRALFHASVGSPSQVLTPFGSVTGTLLLETIVPEARMAFGPPWRIHCVSVTLLVLVGLWVLSIVRYSSKIGPSVLPRVLTSNSRFGMRLKNCVRS